VGPGANGYDLAGHPGVVYPHHPEPIDIRVGATALTDASCRFRDEEVRGNAENSGSRNGVLEEASSRDAGREKIFHGVPSLKWTFEVPTGRLSLTGILVSFYTVFFEM
jgi:hypothetical protein